MLCILIIPFLIVATFADPIWRFPDSRYSPTGRIVGGDPTTIEEVPYQASLQINGFHYCGGSIISKNFVITAGHCAGYPAEWMSVRIGSSKAASSGSLIRVAEVIRHEDFQTNNRGIPINDVALFRLSKPIKFDSTKQPIPLFKHQEEAKEGSMTTITGWGALREGGRSPEVLQIVHVPVVSKDKCNKSYRIYGGLPDGQICAAYPGGAKDACQGDSGGPLAIDGRLAGIVSWGNGCARPNYPGVYTEIASFRDWITKHANV